MFAINATWTAERIELLKTGFEAGLSCRQIADGIGVSRNAVIGKISRLNLSRLEGAGFAARPQNPKPRRPERPSQRQILRALRPRPPVEETPADTPVCCEHRCSLLELGQDKCRWPIGDLGAADVWFCGNTPVKGLPYCAGHARIAYRPSRWRGAHSSA